MYLVILGALLLLMKATDFGPVASWSWWIVLAPFVGAIIWWSWADSSGWTQRREMDKIDQKKADRRRQALDNLGMDERGRRK
jgi:small Trp-rich protein